MDAFMDTIINGFAAQGFDKITQQFKAHFDQGLEHGASLCIQIAGETVVDLWAGYADRAKTKLWQEHSLVQFFSATKPMSAVVLGMLQDRGFLNYDDAIAELWPEFTQYGKEVTIAEALSHQAGVCGLVEPMEQTEWLNLHGIAEKIANEKPLWVPKTASGYHPLTHGYIANELVYRVLGQDLADVFHSDITKPFDIEFYIGLPPELQDRYVQFLPPHEFPNMGEITLPKRVAFFRKWSVPPRTGIEALAAKIPSNNGFGTTRAMASLYGIFANNGHINGIELLSQDTMKDLATSRIRGEDLVLGREVEWATGIMLNTYGVFGPEPKTLGHAGRGGACTFGDPVRNISFAYAPSQHSNAILGDKRANALIDALYSCF